MGVFYVNTTYKPKRKSKKVVEKRPKVIQPFVELKVPPSAQVRAKAKPITGFAAKPEPNIYSGERKLLGIAVLHKSNLVPVFDEQTAKEISSMRRN